MTAKSRALVVRKGKVSDKFHVFVVSIPIPSVTEKPVKCQGKMFDSMLKNTAALQETNREPRTLLAAVGYQASSMP